MMVLYLFTRHSFYAVFPLYSLYAAVNLSIHGCPQKEDTLI